MKRTVLVVVIGAIGLFGAACVASGATFGSTMSGVTTNPGVMNFPETWRVVFSSPAQYGRLTVATMVGVNQDGRGLHGSVYLDGGFPAKLTWTEGPRVGIPEIRHVHVTLEPTGQGAGMMIIIESLFETRNASVTIMSMSCEEL